MVEQNVIDKIHALLNMTTGHGCTENEANTAMEKAQALLLAHNLTQADIRVKEHTIAPGIGQVDKSETEGYAWKVYLMFAISQGNLCKMVSTPQKKTMHLFGTYDNVKASLEMYDWLSGELENRAIKDIKEYRNQGGTEHGRTWRVSYFRAACREIKDRLAKPLETFAQGNGREVVVYNDKAVGEAVKRVYPRLTHSTSYVRQGDGYGYGKQAGSSISLARQRTLTGRLSLGRG